MNIEYTDTHSAIKDFIEGFKEIQSQVDPLNYLLIVTQTQQLTIEQLFQQLQPYFLSEDPIQNSRASLLVLMIFQRLPNLAITDQEFIFLSSFFVEQFHRQETTAESCCIVYLMFMRILTDEQQYDKFKGVINKFLKKCKSDTFKVPHYPQEVRINIYRSLTILCRSFPSHIKSLGADFISTILKVTYNEQDPRNILFVFDLLRFILNEFDTTIIFNYKLIIFEQLDCYYPIEFDENFDKRFTIKQQQLTDGLDACLSSPHLMEYMVLSLEEKLSSSFHQAQEASLTTIQSIFNSNQIIETQYVNKIWTILETFLEHLMGSDFEREYVKAVRSLLSFLHKSSDHQIKKILQYFLLTMQEKPLSINASISLSCLLEAMTISDTMQDMVMTSVLSQFVAKMSYKDEHIAQKQISTILQVIQKSQEKKSSLKSDPILLQNVIMTLQEALLSNQENSIILALKTLITVPHIINVDYGIYDQINKIALSLMQSSNSSIILKKCCIDYLGTIPQNDTTPILQFFDDGVPQEFLNYSKPILFKLSPVIYSNHKEKLKEQLLSEVTPSKDFERDNLVPILRFVMADQSSTEFQFYMTLFLEQPIDMFKQSEKSIIKSLVNHCSKSVYEDYLQVKLGWVLEHLNKTPFLLIIIDNTSDQIFKQFAQEMYSYYQNLKFDYTERNQINSKNFCKLLKRIALNDFDRTVELLDQPVREIYSNFTQNGISKFDCYCMIIRVGLSLNNTQCWSIVQSIVSEGTQFDQFIQDFLLGVVCGSGKIFENYWVLVMEKIILPLLDFQTSQFDGLISSLLIRVEPSTLQQYSEYWQSFLRVIEATLMSADSNQNIESLVRVVLSISQFSDGKINVISLLLQVLKLNVLDIQLISKILMQIGSNSSLGRTNMELQQVVIDTFNSHLDHPKRIIRRSAQFGINSWFMIGSRRM